jgi:predicted Zn-dependent protease
VSADDEEYGHEVFAQLSNQYPIDNDDAHVNRVRDIVDRLSAAVHANKDPWNVYVLKDDKFGNAAATRGNYIFVWSGMLTQVKNDDELAAILAHEIGHLLAGHTAADPSEEVNEIIAGVAGTAVGAVLQQTAVGMVSDLAEALVKASLEALLTNPANQRKELEADQIGLQLMAQAKYDPQRAIDFWERVKTDPNFSGFPVEFLSTHPSSDRRIENLKKNLASAEERYHAAKSGHPEPMDPHEVVAEAQDFNDHTPLPAGELHHGRDGGIEADWQVQVQKVAVHEKPSAKSAISAYLGKDDIVTVEKLEGHWLHITGPYRGYVKSSELAPVNGEER